MAYSERQMREFIYRLCCKNNLLTIDHSFLLLLLLNRRSIDQICKQIRLSDEEGQVILKKISKTLRCSPRTDVVMRVIEQQCAAQYPSMRRYPRDFIDWIITEYTLDPRYSGRLLIRYNEADLAKEQLYYERGTDNLWIRKQSISSVGRNLMDELEVVDNFGLKQRLAYLHIGWKQNNTLKDRIKNLLEQKQVHRDRIKEEYNVYLIPLREALEQTLESAQSV